MGHLLRRASLGAEADGPVEFLGGTGEETNERGSPLRRARDGWRKRNLDGHPLRIPELNGALTKTAAYHMTICAAEPFDYLIRKINDEVLPEVPGPRTPEAEPWKPSEN